MTRNEALEVYRRHGLLLAQFGVRSDVAEKLLELESKISISEVLLKQLSRITPVSDVVMEMARLASERDTERSRIAAALQVAYQHGGNDGSHHKAWVIDQMVRALTGDGYAAWVAKAKREDDDPDAYEWEEGIAP